VQFISTSVRGSLHMPGRVLSILSASFVLVNERYTLFVFLSIVSIELKQAAMEDSTPTRTPFRSSSIEYVEAIRSSEQFGRSVFGLSDEAQTTACVTLHSRLTLPVSSCCFSQFTVVRLKLGCLLSSVSPSFEMTRPHKQNTHFLILRSRRMCLSHPRSSMSSRRPRLRKFQVSQRRKRVG
jgi:hypothetical protein